LPLNGTETGAEPDLWAELHSSPVDLGLRAQCHRDDNDSRTTPTAMRRWTC
jgi:hypothetical protein